MTVIDRPLTSEEREFLVKTLAAHVIADQAPAPCSIDEARAVLARFEAMGQLDIEENAEDAYVRANGTLLVHAKRDWVAYYAFRPGEDALKDERRHDDS